MHSLLLAAFLPLALAGLEQSPTNVLLARQGGDAFVPEPTGFTNCGPEDQCGGGDNSPVVCLDRSRGDVCCAENYGCPGGSFCLTKGYCCPNGDDPNTCAAQNGITLPAGFTAGQTIAQGGPTSGPLASSPTAPPVTSSNPSALSQTYLAGTSTSTPAPSFSVHGNATSQSPAFAPTGSLFPSSTIISFTGGASATRIELIGVFFSLMGSLTGFLLV